MRKITGNSNGKHGRTTTTDRLRRRRRTAFQPPKETLSVVWLKGISSSSAAPCYPLGPRNFHLLCDIAESCLSERSIPRQAGRMGIHDRPSRRREWANEKQRRREKKKLSFWGGGAGKGKDVSDAEEGDGEEVAATAEAAV